MTSDENRVRVTSLDTALLRASSEWREAAYAHQEATRRLEAARKAYDEAYRALYMDKGER